MCTLSLLEASLIFEKLLGWRIISAYIRKKTRCAVRHAETFPSVHPHGFDQRRV
jgi:hypothetical protein